MARILLEHVGVDLPVLGHQARSMKLSMLASATGGRICREAGATWVRALEEVSLDLADGDRLGISGPNGAGKTTLLRVIAGGYPPTRGRRRVEGRIASLIEPGAGIEPEATGWENITIRGLLMGVSRREIGAARPAIGEFSGLGDFLALPVRTYSTGMAMRLAFAIATHFPAEILVLDEWLSVGDAEFRPQAEARMRELVDRTGIMVIASHSAALLDRECDRRIELAHGSVARSWGTERRPSAAHPSAAIA
ncbi:MAG: ABC transporter ATP-binding protein [Phycisphaerales bacterium]